ncbi:STM4015 family protein [Tahibacter amnicola]|uniref:STM4015 family protein n=1 Tax=Tahibacter amnicola TaxID=2976241 RepID=A0ABY6BK50_9GAMM|nr:STM4015 family protein [Tahibacter amnicola]UXI69455.1 STM4015 family protein [Tahibacter amnicola]
MTVNECLGTFYGKPVREFRHGDAITPGDVVYRLTQDYDDEESQEELLADFLGKVDASQLQALVIGAWSEATDRSPDGFLNALIARRAQLPRLAALFVGDMTYEECEISWIIQTGYSALLEAFPALELLRVRGSTDLSFQPVHHAGLRELAIECGGLPSSVVNAIAASRLPSLRRLELWLGDDNYGFDGDLDTYVRLIEAIEPERLEYLGLRNAMISDALAAWLAKQSWLPKIGHLDLSMGTIGDEGAQALLDSPYVAQLRTLDVSHHYISAPLAARLQALPVKVILDDAQDDDERYVEVAE